LSKKLVLAENELHVLRGGDQCRDDECTKLALKRAVGSVFTGPASAIISGTIVVVGNTVYWLQRQINCR